MMRMAVAGLALAAVAAAASQTPTAAEQARFIEEARATALGYSEFLPDFVCTELIHRSASDDGNWRSLDAVTLQLTYAGKKENYKLVVGGKVSNENFLSVGGALSAGEFGSTLRYIFEPSSETAFHWEKAGTVRKTPVWVYSYRVPRAASHYVLAFDGGVGQRTAIVGYHGLVEIAQETNRALRVTMEADDIPAGFAIQGSTTSIDYAFADVGGKQYLLPASAESTMIYQPNRSEVKESVRNLRPKTMRNLLEFRDYRKFAVDSDIDFGGDGKP
jgi:hypothetical protein